MNESNIFANNCKWCGHPQDVDRGKVLIIRKEFKRFVRILIKCGECGKTIFVERHSYEQPMIHYTYPITLHCGKRLF